MVTLFGLATVLSYRGDTGVYLLVILVGMLLNIWNTKDRKMNIEFLILTANVFVIQFFAARASSFSKHALLKAG